MSIEELKLREQMIGEMQDFRDAMVDLVLTMFENKIKQMVKRKMICQTCLDAATSLEEERIKGVA